MNQDISDFIKENKIASIACVDAHNKPYSFNCFYVFDDKNYLLFFKSSLNTHHSRLISNNPNISGCILPDKLNFLSLKGIQFTGSILKNYPDNINPELFYHKKLPLALSKPGHVWFIQLEMVKMSDNTNIFGKKLKWERPAWFDYSPA